MQTYYNPMDKKSVMACIADYEKEGLKTYLTKRNITIKRGKNKYNKYMKWHVEMCVDNYMVASEWFKSKPEAYRNLSGMCQPIPIGDRFSLHINNIKEV